jgi:hypothetical protein
VTAPTPVLLISAYYGSRNCFDFFYANNQFLPSGFVADLTRMAYWGGDLHIIQAVHMQFGALPSEFPNAIHSKHITTFLWLVAVYAPSYVLPFKGSLNVPLGAVLPYLSQEARCDYVARLAGQCLWDQVRSVLCNNAVPVGERQALALEVLVLPHGLAQVHWLRAHMNTFSAWQRLLTTPNLAIVNWLCDNAPGILVERVADAKYPTALHWVAAQHAPAVLEALLFVDDIDTNALNDEGHSPLGVAILNRQIEQVLVLLRHPFVKVSGIRSAQTPLLLMFRTGQFVPEFFSHFELDFAEEIDGRMVLAEMIARDRQEMFTKIFEKGPPESAPNINAIDSRKRTLLHYAVEMGSVWFTQKILRHPRFLPYLDRMDGVLFVFVLSKGS